MSNSLTQHPGRVFLLQEGVTQTPWKESCRDEFWQAPRHFSPSRAPEGKGNCELTGGKPRAADGNSQLRGFKSGRSFGVWIRLLIYTIV